MADFQSTGRVVIERIEAGQNLSADLGSIPVEFDAEGGGGPAGGVAGATGGSGRMQRLGRQSFRATINSEAELAQQTALLEDAVGLLDDGVSPGGGGGGGAGGGGLSDALTGGLLARTLGGGGGGILGGLLGGSAATLAGAGGLGALLGLGGVRALQETGVTDDVREAGEQTGDTLNDVPGGEQAADLAPFVTAGGADVGAAARDLASGDLSFSNFRELQQQRANILAENRNEDPPGELGGRGQSARAQAAADSNRPGADPPFIGPGGDGGAEDPPFFRPPGLGVVDGPGNQTATTPVSQRDGLIGAATDASTPGGTATAGRTRLPDSVSGGDVSVDAPVNVQIEASIDNLDQELDRQLQQIKTEILREVQQEETTSGISQRQQRTLRRGI